MYTAYILESLSNGGYYIGQTNNIEDRLRRHNAGYELSTKAGVPWKLIHSEKFISRAEAMNREQNIKNYKGGKAFKSLIGH